MTNTRTEPEPNRTEPTRLGGPGLEDRVAIDDLYNEYLWALDTGDTQGWLDTFTEDAEAWEDQPDGSTWKMTGKEALRDLIEKYHGDPGFPGHQHREGTRIFRADPEGRPDHWVVKSYTFATTFDVESHTATLYWAGYYRDVVVKRDGEWKLLRRWIAPWKGEVLSAFQERRATAG
ncbi:nuclear transport factor 2 family protein [Herbiconiux sp.]|uniref:nuclear transport factor 2 family protein n=1 Tax=Herbiconiux sp. TaxID=1871186 RepID=UPI0025B8FFF1|nr:nuclear transport factor 2 family protein [Herbiconiux sp.]